MAKWIMADWKAIWMVGRTDERLDGVIDDWLGGLMDG